MNFESIGVWDMGAYELNTIVKMWGQGKLTAEQAIGQLLLQTQALTERVGLLEKHVDNLLAAVRRKEK
jgi:hypothetical protein